jgi:hypothetical protein
MLLEGSSNQLQGGAMLWLHVLGLRLAPVDPANEVYTTKKDDRHARHSCFWLLVFAIRIHVISHWQQLRGSPTMHFISLLMRCILELRSSASIRVGCAGQSVVQFAFHKASRQECAMKLYLSMAAFQDDSKQYNKGSPLLRFLPNLHALVENSNGEFKDAFRRDMPPCIVMERGESLDKWVQRNQRGMDMFTCMQVWIQR